MHRNRRIRRLLVVMLLIVVAVPLLAFGISNLYLISPKGRLIVESKITRRIGLPTSIEGSTWSPWNGITLYGIHIEQPPPLSSALKAPLLTVESIRVSPDWKVLIRNRQLLAKGIDVRKPKLNVPLELLSQIPTSPPLLPNTTATNPTNSSSISEPPPNLETPATQPQPQPPVSTIGSLPNEEKTVASSKSQKQTVPPTVWINFSDADIRLISTSTKEPIYEISGANGGFPVAGKSAEKDIKIRKVECFGNEIASDISLPLEWSAPLLKTGTVDGKFFNIDCSAKAEISLTNGMPFQIIATMPEQDDKEVHLGKTIQAKLGKVSGRGIMQGLLAFPASWQGQCVFQSISVKAKQKGRAADFDYAQAILIFRNGALSCVDARLVGDTISLLGNATLLSDGRGAANLRIIAPPDTLAAIAKEAEPGSASPTFTALSTPQRAALDLQIFGKTGEFFYKPDPRAESIPLQ